MKPSGYTNNGKFTYSDDQRMYVLLKPGETVYYGVHRIPHALNNVTNGAVNQHNLIISARWSADGKGIGTVGRVSKIYRDSSTANTTAALRGSAFLTPQAGVIADTVQNRVGPKVGGLPANGYTPLAYTNSTGATQYVWFEFVQEGEFTATGTYNTAFTESQRFSTYDFWDFTVKDNAGVEKPGRLFSKQWAFSSGGGSNVFSAAFNMYPLIPSPLNVGRYFVKKFELAGLAPQNLFRFVSNSKGSTASATDFTMSRKSQTTELDYPEYFNFVNDPDPTVWPSADDPDLKVVSTASYCKGTGGVMDFFVSSALGGNINIVIDLNGTVGYQAGTRDVLISQTIPVGNSRIQWNGLDGLNAVVSSGTKVTLTFKNSISPIAPVNFPLYDAENNVGGFRIQNVRPGRQGFDVLYWDDSNLSTTLFPDAAATPRVQAAGVSSINGVHSWGGATGTTNAGDNYLVNTYTYGNTEQQTRDFTFTYVCDPDGDGINDNLDIDQDNDGITNTAESGGIDPTTITVTGVPRYLDPYEANFVDINGDGVNDVYDLDLDGRPNFLDVDADGDGIPDAIEANGGTAPTGYVATTNRIGGTIGANGMPDAAETAAESGVTKLPLTNTDNVGRPDFLDIDSDDDGIVDNIEAQASAEYQAPSGIDTDYDGMDNTYDPTPGGTVAAGTAVLITNTDGADLPDYRDLNSDNDSRTDAVEGWDTTNDGVASTVANGVDADGDGLDDAFDNNTTLTNPTNGQTPTSFPNLGTPGTTERDWRETFTPASVATITISGRVFDDVNYGGGAGRNYTAAATAASSFTLGRANAVVELYDANGAFVATTITPAGGVYTFNLANQPAGSYTVRVVNRSVTSARTATGITGTTTSVLLPVQTYANGAINKVGGEVPSKTDAPANTGTQTLADIINGTTTTAQSITGITIPSTSTTTATVTGVDFGFNFDVISSTNSSGQGSLAQFITNSNALSNTNLNQTGLATPGVETSIFMIGDGKSTSTPPPGLRSGISGGVDPNTGIATIKLTTALPNIVDARTNLDGSRQTALTGSTPTSSSDSSTDPEVVVDFNSLKGLFVTGANTRIASIGLNNAAGTVATAATGAIFSDGAAVTFSSATTAGSVLTDVTALNSASAGVRIQGSTTTAAGSATVATNITITNNVFNNGTAYTVSGSVRDGDGINLVGVSGNTITGNVINNNKGFGIYLATTANTNNNISNNIIRGNGSGSSTDDAGIAIAFGTNNLISKNIISGSTGDAIVAFQSTATSTSGNRFTQNQTTSNGKLGINLTNTTVAVAPDGVTTNVDSGTATGPNGRLNFPVFTQATINGGVLRVTGYSPPGALIEIFLADNDPTKFGEGRTYLTSATEGSSADLDSKWGPYSGNMSANGIAASAVSSGSETNASRFMFSLPLTSDQLSLLQTGGAQITATATALSTTLVNGVAVGNTSEFSANAFLVTTPLPVELTSFLVQAKVNDAVLSWTTASEKNNDHFAVERSADGKNFVQVGKVQGHGTSTAVHSYRFVEASAARHGQLLYYRLRQVDADGAESFSPVSTVSFAAAAAATEVGVYPNPATTETTLDLTMLPAGTYSVSVTDLTGRSYSVQQLIGGQSHLLDLRGVSAGAYLLVIRGENTLLTQRLLKQN
ncbi:T9SS type A sorting domain-containing protein [Hymenobacter cavernae]|uniref:T9SS type A sorting domain-containing protein n=1 Tax=Hymenobacter cavernae TaxID=2044852 RepID=UPI00166F0E97|nr:T9SS type A sorting domain-containing protein [Hymenobacter cavernae]